MNAKIKKLEKKAVWVRRKILEAIAAAKKGHIGGALSCTDILVALYYGGSLCFNARNPKWDKRDRLIMSKGHSGITLYAILADLGFFPVQELNSFCKDKTMLGGHPDRHIPGIEADTGSLGHGLGIGAGLALAAKLDKKSHMVFVLLGDGECHEGSVWEAAMFAAQHKLRNLVAIVDRNNQCVMDFTENCLSLEPLAGKWKSFGWEARVVDGHSFQELLGVFRGLRARKSVTPLVIIAQTIKGKGISFMEGQIAWHHGIPSGQLLEKASEELDKGGLLK